MRPLTVAIVSLAWASGLSAEPLPGFLNSNDVERSLPAPNLPADVYRPSAPDLQVAAPVPQPQAFMSKRVRLHKVRFEGGTLYPLSDLRDNYQDLINREVSLAELNEATQRLTRRYQQDGYLLSYAYLPAQDFADGRVQVVLVEGYIRDYELQGDIGPASAYLDKLATRLKTERPLTRETLQRYTGLMSRVPGVTLRAQVEAPDSHDGASKLIVQASRKAVSSTLTLSDGSRDDLQALLSVSSNAQTALAEQVSFSALLPPGDDHEYYYRLDYAQYLDSQGSQLNLSASQYRSEPRARVRLNNGIDLKQRRENDRYSVGLSQVLIGAPDEWLSAGGRLYAVNDDTDYHAVDVPLRISSRTDVRALAFEGDWRKADPRQLRILSVGAYQGMDYLGANTTGDIDLDFLRLRVSGLQSDRFFDHWQGVVSAALFWTNDSLPDSERAVFGGQTFGRGYPSDQASGDKGWGAAYELNYSFKRDSGWLRQVQPYVVVDASRSWFNELEIRDSRLSSAALGLRLGDARSYNISMEAAKPMSDIALDSLNRQPRFTVSFSCQL
ncbi:ShlB/FhaC/HecB family hemolysin secretion/activation protein [Pseudomonas sp. UM16]|uniref:ShlB/FhaC/HecB family hemolysin secretion/activation protein n=1 Tax=Pseudomonas sp. UM16 TaxID=3158962 RepID=UPI00398FE3B5